MAAVTPDINQARAMRVAVKRIEGFAKQFGEVHRNLARHAAFPFVLTPDLLYQIWANFVPEAPWTAVAHVLLSRLCRQVGYEMYEMDIADRNLLLRELKDQFGQERLDELGEFLLDYVAQQLTDDAPDTQDLREAQEWTALAYTKPDEAARELAEALSSRVKQKDMADVLRLASLIETFAEPLADAGFEPLLIYSGGIASFVRGEMEGAKAQFSKFSEQIRQGEVTKNSSENLEKLELIVVDDESDNVDLLWRTFRRDFRVFKADSAHAALEILEQEGEMAVIISDQRMPEMNGTEFFRIAAERFPDTMRILVTGYTDVEDLVDAINSGYVFKYITKPWNAENLEAIVQYAADTHRILKRRINELHRQFLLNKNDPNFLSKIIALSTKSDRSNHP